MIPLPNVLAAFVNKSGQIIRPWNSYLQQFTQQPPSVVSITVSGSPFSYTAREPGNIAITNGTISNIRLSRGIVDIDFGAGTDKIIPAGINDIITITYSVLPTVRFLPSYGQTAA